MAHDAPNRARITRAIALYLTDLAVTTPLDSQMITWSLEGTAGDTTRLQVRFLVDPDALLSLAADVEAMDAIEALQRRMREGHTDPTTGLAWAPGDFGDAQPPRTAQETREAPRTDDVGQPLDAADVGDAEPPAEASTDDVVTALMPYICGTCKTRWPTPNALLGHRRLVHGAH